jgi:MFS family permease
LLFADHGISPAAMSSLFVIWSVTAFVLEVPSGAWADLADRRTLLMLSASIYAAGFAVWITWPTYAGFATGFVLWGLSGALMSGTFEALLYDELAVRDATDMYAGLLGHANAAATAASVTATTAAAPLLAWGGYAAVAWFSVAVALLHGALACWLPAAPRTETADTTDIQAGPDPTFVARYVSTLRAGISEATGRPQIRPLLVVVSVLYGMTAYDEYFPAVAREAGASTAHVPWLLGLTLAGQFIGSALAGRTDRGSRRAIAGAIGVAGVLIATGALAGHPAAFVAIAVGYGLTENAIVVGDAKLQASISGPARATVTSVSGLASEVVAVAIFVAVAVGSAWLTTSALLAIVALPTLLVAVTARRWWPESAPPPTRHDGTDSEYRQVRAERDVVRSPDDVALSRTSEASKPPTA